MKNKQAAAIFSLLSASLLSACDPKFESEADLCANGEKSEVVLALDFTDPDISPYLTTPGRDSNEYRLYLQDILERSEPAPGEVISAELQTALASFDTLLNGDEIDEFGLNYVMDAGLVTGASNPIDYIESVMASTDSNTQIGAFEDARKQIDRGIDADDDFCNYINPNIRIVDQDGIAVLFSELDLSYNPFTRIVQQSFLVSELRADLDGITARQTVPYFGFSQASSGDYAPEGFYPTNQRSALVNTPDGFRSLLVDIGQDISLEQLEISTRNTVCEDEDGNTIDGDGNIVRCDGAVTTRAPAKSQCDGSDPDGSDESNTIQVRSIALNGTYTDLKRIRLETDIDSEEVRIYASRYNEAILDSDGITEIFDPTDCEKQAVLDELAVDLEPGDEGVRLTIIEDEGYDIIFDDDGELITTPAYTYNGSELL